MQDIGFFLNGVCADVVQENGDLKADDGLETAVLISLFTDRFVEVEDLPDGETDPRGWWGDLVSTPEDDQIGSTLWTILRGKILPDTANKMEDSAKVALNWMLEDGITDEVIVSAERVNDEEIDLAISIARPEGDNIVFKFIWDGQELRREAA